MDWPALEWPLGHHGHHWLAYAAPHRAQSLPVLEPSLRGFFHQQRLLFYSFLGCPISKWCSPIHCWSRALYSHSQGPTRSIFAIMVALIIYTKFWHFTYFVWNKWTVLWCNINSISYTSFSDLLVLLNLTYFRKKGRSTRLKCSEIWWNFQCSSVIAKGWLLKFRRQRR